MPAARYPRYQRLKREWDWEEREEKLKFHRPEGGHEAFMVAPFCFSLDTRKAFCCPSVGSIMLQFVLCLSLFVLRPRDM